MDTKDRTTRQEIAGRIIRLREARGWNKKELAQRLHVSASMVSDWERCVKGVAAHWLTDLSTVLGVSIDYLMGRTGEPNPASPNAPSLLPPGTWPRGRTRPIPILGTIRAGLPILAAENVIGHEEVDVQIVGDAADSSFFFLRVAGDSMLPARIAEGDLVLLHEQPTVENGEIAAVMVGAEEAALKRVFYRGGTLVLVSDNSKYPPLVVRPEDARIVGKAVRVVIEPK